MEEVCASITVVIFHTREIGRMDLNMEWANSLIMDMQCIMGYGSKGCLMEGVNYILATLTIQLVVLLMTVAQIMIAILEIFKQYKNMQACSKTAKYKDMEQYFIAMVTK